MRGHRKVLLGTRGAGQRQPATVLLSASKGPVFGPKVAAEQAMMELELQRLDRKYAGLRVLALDKLGPLMASLSEVGQQNPVLVVTTSANTGVLIDGYRRVAALHKLGRDTVFALAVALSEADALVLRHQLAAAQQRTALEDGWLLRELLDSHDVSQRHLAVRMSKSPSWISRRLGLVNDLPESAQELVRSGDVPAQAAMKYLLSLSRDNKSACERLVASLKGQRWSEKELRAIYVCWRKASKEQRNEIETKPRLCCDSQAEAKKPLPVDDPQARDLVVGLTRLASAAWRVRGLAQEQTRSLGKLEPADLLAGLWNDAEERITALRKVILEGLGHA